MRQTAAVERDERGKWITSGNPAGGTPLLDLRDAATRDRVVTALRESETMTAAADALGVHRVTLWRWLGEDDDLYALQQRLLRGRRAAMAHEAQEMASRAMHRLQRDIESGSGKDVQAVTIAYGILADQAARQGGLADASQRLQVRLAVADRIVAAEVTQQGS